MKKKSKFLWLTDICFVLLTIASFTGILIPAGQTDPSFLGAPYTVWMGVVFCILYILLAYIASNLQREESDDH